MVEARKTERANALREVKRLCKEFGVTAGMLKGYLNRYVNMGRFERVRSSPQQAYKSKPIYLERQTCQLCVE